jgi:hypothetical protein
MAFRHLEISLYRLQQSRFLRRPEGRLLFPRPIRLLKTSLKRLHQSFFCAQHAESVFACPFVTLKHRIIEFTNVLKADYVFSGPFAYLKHHLSDFISFACLEAQKAEHVVVWPFDTLKHRFIDFTKVVFKTSESHMISQDHSPT